MRRALGVFLIAVSLVCFTAALLGLPVDFHFDQGVVQFFARSAPVFWLLVASGLGYAAVLSVGARDKVGVVLGLFGLGLAATYLAASYLAKGLSHSVLAPSAAFVLSVVVTILGWHLLMPPRQSLERA